MNRLIDIKINTRILLKLNKQVIGLLIKSSAIAYALHTLLKN